MQDKHDWAIHQVSVVGLLLGAHFGRSPWASVAAVAVLFGARLVDRYLHNSFFDEHDRLIKQLATDLATVKAKQSQDGLKSAFKAPGGQG